MDILHLEGYSFAEKILLAEIASFTRKGRDCFATNAHFMELMQLKERQVRRIISKLQHGGLIAVTYKHIDGKTRRVLKALTPVTHDLPTPVTDDPPTRSRMTSPPGHGRPPPPVMDDPRTIQVTNTTTKTTTMDSNLKTDYGEAAPYFVHLAEGTHVSATAAREMARNFVAYYTAREWRTDRGPITAWKPVAAAWFRKGAERIPQRAVKRQRGEAEIRADIRWHERRRDNYSDIKPHLVQKEINAIRALENELANLTPPEL